MEVLNKIAKKGFMLLVLLLLAVNGCSFLVSAGNGGDSGIDESRTGSVRIEKKIRDLKDGSEKPAEGVCIQLTYQSRLDAGTVEAKDEDYFRETRVTDADGVAEFRNLALGTYLVEETGGITEGMEKSEAFLVSVPSLNITEVTFEDTVYPPGTFWEYDITAAPKSQPILGGVRLIKTDADTGNVLKGAVFRLYTSDGEPYQTSSGKTVELTTSRDGILEVLNLPYGKYYFREIKAPNGYKLSNKKWSFSITESYREELADTLVTVEAENVRKEEPAGPPDPEKPVPEPGPGSDSRYSRSPRTGDPSDIVNWMILLGLSLSVTGILASGRRRRE